MVVVVVMDDCSWSRLVIIVVMDNCGGLRVVLTIVAITVVLSIATMVMCPVSWTLVGRYMCDNRLREVPGCITRTTSAFMSAAPGLLGGRPAGGPVAVASLAVIDMCHLHVPSLVDDLVLDQRLWRHRDRHLDDFPRIPHRHRNMHNTMDWRGRLWHRQGDLLVNVLGYHMRMPRDRNFDDLWEDHGLARSPPCG